VHPRPRGRCGPRHSRCRSRVLRLHARRRRRADPVHRRRRVARYGRSDQRRTGIERTATRRPRTNPPHTQAVHSPTVPRLMLMDARGCRTSRSPAVMAAWAAFALGLTYAAMSAYWGLGGTALLDTLGGKLSAKHAAARLGRRSSSGSCSRQARRRAAADHGDLVRRLAPRTAVAARGVLDQRARVDGPWAHPHIGRARGPGPAWLSPRLTPTLAWQAFLWNPWFLWRHRRITAW
jgi:hypothetical protein